MGTVTIIGAGMMGSAMSRPASDNGHSVRLAGTPLDEEIIAAVKAGKDHPTLRRKMPEGLKAYSCSELKAALDGADLVIGGVSSFGVEWFRTDVLPLLKPGSTVLSITKGLNALPDGSLEPFPEMLSKVRPDVNFLAVGGPCICFELFDRRNTVVYFCGKDFPARSRAVKVLATDYYHPVSTADVKGVEGSVAMKNAYAMGVSLAVGIAEREIGITGTQGMTGTARPGAPDANPVFNPQAALFGQSVIEIRRIVKLMGGDSDFACGLAGAGDLYVTVFGGRTRKLGTLLGRGLSFPEAKAALKGVTLESVAIIALAADSVRRTADPKRFPLLMAMDEIIRGGKQVRIPWNEFGK